MSKDYTRDKIKEILSEVSGAERNDEGDEKVLGLLINAISHLVSYNEELEIELAEMNEDLLALKAEMNEDLLALKIEFVNTLKLGR